MMIYYNCNAIDYVRSFPEVRSFYESLATVAENEKTQGKGSKTRCDKKHLAGRRRFFKKIFERRKEARPETKKESLNYNPISIIMPFTGGTLCA
jgi:hypothetical protein